MLPVFSYLTKNIWTGIPVGKPDNSFSQMDFGLLHLHLRHFLHVHCHFLHLHCHLVRHLHFLRVHILHLAHVHLFHFHPHLLHVHSQVLHVSSHLLHVHFHTSVRIHLKISGLCRTISIVIGILAKKRKKRAIISDCFIFSNY